MFTENHKNENCVLHNKNDLFVSKICIYENKCTGIFKFFKDFNGNVYENDTNKIVSILAIQNFLYFFPKMFNIFVKFQFLLNSREVFIPTLANRKMSKN